VSEPDSPKPPKRERPRELRLHIIVGIALVIAALAAAAAGVIIPRVLLERRVRPWRERAGLWNCRNDEKDGASDIALAHCEVEGDIITAKGFSPNIFASTSPRKIHSWAGKLRIISADEAQGEVISCSGMRGTVILRAQGDGSLVIEAAAIDLEEKQRVRMTRAGEDDEMIRNWSSHLKDIARQLENMTPEELFGEENAQVWREWWAEKSHEYRPKMP